MTLLVMVSLLWSCKSEGETTESSATDVKDQQTVSNGAIEETQEVEGKRKVLDDTERDADEPKYHQQPYIPLTKASVSFLRVIRGDHALLFHLNYNSLEDLIEDVRYHFAEPRLTRLLTINGDPVLSLEQLYTLKVGRKANIAKVIAKPPESEELFMWSGLEIGEETKLLLGDRQVTIKTVSTIPRLFEIDNFLSDEECDHLVEMAKMQGLQRAKIVSEGTLTVSPGRTRFDSTFGLVSVDVSLDEMRYVDFVD